MKNRLYPRELKLKAVEMRTAGVPVKELMRVLFTNFQSVCVQ